ncbi:MAG: DUF6438 domain-containing protein [Saprospiraceae bacterium]|nr:DUF6438 domain-containing protein [Saprospiraceae bacterium]
MSKGACFGRCPVYELKIYHKGYVTFLGLQNTKNLGLFERKLSKQDYKDVIKAFEKLDFDKYPDNFDSRIPDLPEIKIGFHNGSKFRIVTGKENRPEDLMQAQFELEKIIDNNNWTLLKSLEEVQSNIKKEDPIIENEVIISPKKGLLLTKWLASKDEYGVRLIKKIAPALDLYLIAFDTDKIKPKTFLRLLQQDKDILSAEFNKRTTQRDN